MECMDHIDGAGWLSPDGEFYRLHHNVMHRALARDVLECVFRSDDITAEDFDDPELALTGRRWMKIGSRTGLGGDDFHGPASFEATPIQRTMIIELYFRFGCIMPRWLREAAKEYNDAELDAEW